MTERAIVLLAHGSRDPSWCTPILQVAQRIVELDASACVRCAYLELCPPDLPTTVAELVALGIGQVDILPMFLGLGKHSRADLPRLLDAMHERYPQLRIHLSSAVGERAEVHDLLARLALG